MKFEVYINPNHVASIIEVKYLAPLENSRHLQMLYTNENKLKSNAIIVSKEVQLGDVGIIFPSYLRINPNFIKKLEPYDGHNVKIGSYTTMILDDEFYIIEFNITDNGYTYQSHGGLFLPICVLNNYSDLPMSSKELNKLAGTYFTHIDGIEICKFDSY